MKSGKRIGKRTGKLPILFWGIYKYKQASLHHHKNMPKTTKLDLTKQVSIISLIKLYIKFNFNTHTRTNTQIGRQAYNKQFVSKRVYLL